jgi:hypothetical protein
MSWISEIKNSPGFNSDELQLPESNQRQSVLKRTPEADGLGTYVNLSCRE